MLSSRSYDENSFSTKKSKTNLQLKNDLSVIWKAIMDSFSYQKYYRSKNTSSNQISNNSIQNSIKLFQKFMEENSISQKENYILFSNNSKNNICLLSEPKLWIMHIIVFNYLSTTENIEKNILITFNLFKEAINYDCDIISLFEFFLIYLSNIPKELFKKLLEKKGVKLIPEEFFNLYNQKNEELRDIFYVEKKFKNPKEYNFDINNVYVISKDYLNKGFFIIFKEKDDKIFCDDEEEESYYLMPLYNNFESYDKKMEANKTLDLLNKSIYKDYTYFPYDLSVINRLISGL